MEQNYNNLDNADVAEATQHLWLDSSYITSNEIEKKKAKITGNFLELYEFSIAINHEVNQNKVRSFNPDNIRKGNNRAISQIKSIIAGNFNNKRTKFIVLTFKGKLNFDKQNLRICNQKKQTFIKKLQAKYGYNFKYLIIPEYQKKGAVHYHMLAEIPYLNKEELEKIWSYGYCHISNIKKKHQTAEYITKELVKQMKKITYYVSKNIKKVEYKGLRRYYCSNSVQKPEIFYGKEAERLVKYCSKFEPKLIEEKEFYVDFVGYVKYRAYKLSKRIKAKDIDRVVYFYNGYG